MTDKEKIELLRSALTSLLWWHKEGQWDQESHPFEMEICDYENTTFAQEALDKTAD